MLSLVRYLLQDYLDGRAPEAVCWGAHGWTARRAHSPTRGAMLQESTNALVLARRKLAGPEVKLSRSLLTLFINCSCVVATVKRYAVSSTHAELDFLVVRAYRGQIDREQAWRAPHPHPQPATRAPRPLPSPMPTPQHPTPNHPHLLHLLTLHSFLLCSNGWPGQRLAVAR